MYQTFADFLPEATCRLQEPAALALIYNLQRRPTATYLSNLPIKTACVVEGRGDEPVLLLHGFDSSVLEFRRLLPCLATAARTWAVDLLGFGFTERPSDIAYTPAAIKHHLYRFWRTCIREPVTLVGTSMGGAVAIDFATTYPDAVGKLVLINSMGFTGAPSLFRLLPAPFDSLAVEYLRQRKLQALALAEKVTHVSTDDIRCAALHLEMPGWQQSLVSFNHSGGYSSLALPMASIATETLILWGRGDDVLGDLDAQKFTRTIRNSHLVWIEAGGHTPQLTQPERTARHILEFVLGQTG